MCSFQTSTGTLLMLLVEEKMGAAAVDEDDELLLVFCRLGGGARAALLGLVVCSVSWASICSGFSGPKIPRFWPTRPTRMSLLFSIADLKKAYTVAGTDVLNHSMLSSQMPCPVRTVWCVPWININVVRQASIHSWKLGHHQGDLVDRVSSISLDRD